LRVLFHSHCEERDEKATTWNCDKEQTNFFVKKM